MNIQVNNPNLEWIYCYGVRTSYPTIGDFREATAAYFGIVLPEPEPL